MTYVTGGLIQAADYNGFVSTTAGANINATWNSAYSQPALSTVVVGGTVTAAQWATLNTTISQMGAHQGTTITSRTNPVAGNIISVLANVNADITNCYNNRANAAIVGTQFTGWTGIASFPGGIGNTSGNVDGRWTATFTDTVTFSNTSAATSFFNAGGLIKIQFSKTSTGTTGPGSSGSTGASIGRSPKRPSSGRSRNSPLPPGKAPSRSRRSRSEGRSVRARG